MLALTSKVNSDVPAVVASLLVSSLVGFVVAEYWMILIASLVANLFLIWESWGEEFGYLHNELFLFNFLFIGFFAACGVLLGVFARRGWRSLLRSRP